MLLSLYFHCHVQALPGGQVTKHQSSPLHRSSPPSYPPTRRGARARTGATRCTRSSRRIAPSPACLTPSPTCPALGRVRASGCDPLIECVGHSSECVGHSSRGAVGWVDTPPTCPTPTPACPAHVRVRASGRDPLTGCVGHSSTCIELSSRVGWVTWPAGWFRITHIGGFRRRTTSMRRQHPV